MAWSDIQSSLAPAADGDFRVVRDARAVEQSLRTLMAIRPGDVPYRPNLGSRVSSLLFAAGDSNLAGLARTYVEEAFDQEPRAELLDVEAVRDGQRVRVSVDWRVFGEDGRRSFDVLVERA